MYGTYTCNPEVALVPLNYNGFTENFTEQIKVGNFGQVERSKMKLKIYLLTILIKQFYQDCFYVKN